MTFFRIRFCLWVLQRNQMKVSSHCNDVTVDQNFHYFDGPAQSGNLPQRLPGPSGA